MELNLRKARKMESSIQKFFVENPVNSSTEIRFYGTPQEAQETVSEARQEFLLNMENRNKLLALRYSIRRKIEVMNEECGINSLLNEKVLLENLGTEIRSVLNGGAPSDKKSLEDLIKSGLKVLEAGSYNYGVPKTSDSVNIFCEQDLEDFRVKLVAINKKLEAVDDSLSEKNLSTKILLSEEDTKLLESNKLL